MTFRVGQKVVCIKRGPWKKMHAREIGPTYGDILTIRGITDDRHGVYLRFYEIRNPPVSTDPDTGCLDEAKFNAKGFRPLIERPTDTGFAILKRLEIPSDRKIKERA